MPTYGRQVLGTTGTDIQVTADGMPDWHAIGITIDWSTVAAVSGSDATYTDETVVKVGLKGLEYGTVLCKITTQEVQTITLANATGGTFPIGSNNVAYNASAATVQAAIRALGGAYVGAVVSGAGPYTVTFPADAGDVPALTTSNTNLTGSSPTIAVATTTPGAAGGGKWGPYDSGASDGRQTLSRGNCVILNRTTLEQGFAGVVATASDHPGVIEGGLVWKARVKAGGSGQPSWANLEAALPRLRYVQ